MTRTGGEKRRHLLIEEAIRHFGRDGYNGASLDVIASAAGIRKQTLLYYFPTKEALLEACLAAAGQRLAETLTEALAGRETYWERAEAVIHAVFRLAEDRLVLTEVAPGIDVRKDVLARMQFAPIVPREPAVMAAAHFAE